MILDGSARVSVGSTEVARSGRATRSARWRSIDGDARSASVTAGEGLRCAGMTQWHFRPFVRDHHDFAWAIMRGLVKRVRDAQRR